MTLLGMQLRPTRMMSMFRPTPVLNPPACLRVTTGTCARWTSADPAVSVCTSRLKACATTGTPAPMLPNVLKAHARGRLRSTAMMGSQALQAAVLDHDGTVLSTDMPIAGADLYSQQWNGAPGAAAFADDRILLYWPPQYGWKEEFYYLFLDSGGQLDGPIHTFETTNTSASGSIAQLSMAVFPDSSFIAVWSAPDDFLSGIYAQRFNPDGSPKYK